MRRTLLVKMLICLFSFGGVLYAYLEKQNDYTKLRIELPTLAKEVRLLEEEIASLQYEVERFENPKHLMELAKRPEFSYLKYPILNDVVVLKKESGSKEMSSEIVTKHQVPSQIFIGAK